MICICMMIALAACAGTENENLAGQIESDGTTDNAQEETEKVAEPVETTEAEGTTEAPLFDNSWASNEYEAQLPELPFTWTVGEAHEPNSYLMKVKDVLYTDAKAYGEVLMTCGFDIDLWVDDTTEGGNYRVIAQNKNGYRIDYDFNAYSYEQPITGLLRISIEKVLP